jgi:CRISPR-associated endoribonuclease Cas6
MRVKLHLSLVSDRAVVSHGYSHGITGFLYSALKQADPETASYIHNSMQSCKPIVFSNLRGKDISVDRNGLTIGKAGCDLFIGSPLESVMETLTRGIEELSISPVAFGGSSFVIESIKPVADPLLNDCQAFTCLSPIVVTAAPIEGVPDSRSIYLRYADDPELFSEAINANLIRKLREIYGQELPPDEGISFRFDEAYAASHRIDRLVEYAGHKFHCYLAPFRVEGSPWLIQMGYDLGFGGKNFMGFGMAVPADL